MCSYRSASLAGRTWTRCIRPSTEFDECFASPGGAVLDKARMYELPMRLHLTECGLTGDWTVKNQAATLKGQWTHRRFHARDLHPASCDEERRQRQGGARDVYRGKRKAAP